jgi:hypothetical protein
LIVFALSTAVIRLARVGAAALADGGASIVLNSRTPAITAARKRILRMRNQAFA